MHATLARFAVALVLGAALTAYGAPQVVRSAFGIYAHESDNTAQCLPDARVCIGNEYSARNSPHLRELGITHVVSAIGEPHERLAGVEYLAFYVDDSTSQSLAEVLEHSYEFISHALAAREDARVLVHCAAGVSRSASLVIYWMMRSRGIDYDTAYAELVAVRDVVSPNYGFRAQLRRYDSDRRRNEL